eukprot:6477188-Amphidinium_carterae.1
MDYRSEPPEAGARIESWHSDGRYTLDVEDNKEVMKFQIDGLPGQGRAGRPMEHDEQSSEPERLQSSPQTQQHDVNQSCVSAQPSSHLSRQGLSVFFFVPDALLAYVTPRQKLVQ